MSNNQDARTGSGSEKIGPPPMSIKGPLMFGLVVVALVFGGGGVASNYIEIDQSVIIPAQVTLDANPVPVSVDTVGAVSDVYVKEGDVVEAGDLLIRMDAETIEIELRDEVQSLIIEELRAARMEAELARSEVLPMPEVEPGYEDFLKYHHRIEASVLKQRLKSLEVSTEVLAGEAERMRKQASRMVAEISQMEALRETFSSERDRLQPLADQGIISGARQTESARQILQTEREIESLKTRQMDATQSALSKDKESLQLIAEWDREAAERLQESVGRIATTRSRIAVLKRDLSKKIVTAPADGIVFQLQARHAGFVVTTGEPIMKIVPQNSRLVARGRLAVDDLDDIRTESSAIIQLVAYAELKTPQMDGVIVRVAPHASTDERQGMSFFEVDVELSLETYRALTKSEPTPGEPLQVLIPVRQGTLFSVLAYPVTKRLPELFQI